MAGKVSAFDLQQKSEGIGFLMEKVQGTSAKTNKPYHLAKFGYMGTSITYFIPQEDKFNQLQEGQIYKISGTLSERSDGGGLQLDNARFEKLDATL